ncbi:MAG: hypothetical protein VYA39_00940 [Candidatus Thermoplasmatota archaeon]|nr:hypothetical protein [Candidatus Thermoplasmatota archaeon]MEC7708274.1 hypothetical protein [Candidatus Thermoplasmatota archaeon]
MSYLTTVAMLSITAFLLWVIFSLGRQRAMMSQIEPDSDYVGHAVNPEALMSPDKEAIEDMESLMEEAGVNWED